MCCPASTPEQTGAFGSPAETKGAGNTLFHCCICLQCVLPCVTCTFGLQAQVCFSPTPTPFYHSITSIAPIIPLQKDQVMRRKPETLHIVACQNTSVTAVIHSIKIFNPKGRYSPLEQFTTALAP